MWKTPLLKNSGTAAVLALALGMLFAAQAFPVLAQTPPQEITRSQIRLFSSETEVVGGPFPGLLLIPNTRPSYRDEKYDRPYHVACHVYVEVPSVHGGSEPVYRRRFLVCAADTDGLALTRQVARFLLMLYGERRERIHDDHPENLPTVNVWLTERVEPGLSQDTGGEQFQNQIYIYNIHRERPPIEWAREVAHEYGHYALPGVSGFTEPEEWANGVLGERLFLKWIRDDLRAGRLKNDDLVFVTGDLLDDYFARTVWPLIRRILREGADARMLTRTKAEGMDYYTGIALYVDTVYGSSVLVDAMQDTRSASPLTFPRASDFLTGVRRALNSDKEFVLSLPALGAAEKENTLFFYLPAGAWLVRPEGSALSWRVRTDSKSGIACTGTLVKARIGGWYPLAYVRASDTAVPARLTFRKRGQAR